MLTLLFASGPGQQRLRPSLCFLPHAFETPEGDWTTTFPTEALPVTLPYEALPVDLPGDALAVTYPADALPVAGPEIV